MYSTIFFRIKGVLLYVKVDNGNLDNSKSLKEEGFKIYQKLKMKEIETNNPGEFEKILDQYIISIRKINEYMRFCHVFLTTRKEYLSDDYSKTKLFDFVYNLYYLTTYTIFEFEKCKKNERTFAFCA